MTVSLNSNQAHQATSSPMTHTCGVGCQHCASQMSSTAKQSYRPQATYFGFKGGGVNLLKAADVARGNTENVLGDYIDFEYISSEAGSAETAISPKKDGFNPLTAVKNLMKGMLYGGIILGTGLTALTIAAARYVKKKALAVATHVKATPNKVLAKQVGTRLLNFGTRFAKLGWRVFNSPIMWLMPGLKGVKLASKFPRIARWVGRIGRGKQALQWMSRLPVIGKRLKFAKKL